MARGVKPTITLLVDGQHTTLNKLHPLHQSLRTPVLLTSWSSSIDSLLRLLLWVPFSPSHVYNVTFFISSIPKTVISFRSYRLRGLKHAHRGLWILDDEIKESKYTVCARVRTYVQLRVLSKTKEAKESLLKSRNALRSTDAHPSNRRINQRQSPNQ